MNRYTRRPLAVLLAAGLALVGCSSNSGDSANDTANDTTNDTSAATTAAPVASGGGGEVDEISWYTFYRPVLGLVAFQFADYPEAMVSANLCEPLMRLTPDFELVPGLAEFTPVDDLTYRYAIRDGAAFWDGTPVTTDDVIFSLGMHKDPTFRSAYFSPHTNVASVTAVDAKTVEIKLMKPDNTFNGMMAGPAGTIYQKAQAQTAGAKWGTSEAGVMCSGPYKTGEWVPGESITIERNDTYWSKDFSPKVKKIKFIWPQDPGAITSAIAAGDIDGGYELPPATLKTLQDSKAGTLTISEPSGSFQNFSLIVGNLADGPLADVRVRKALYAALDRQAIADVVMAGAGAPLYTLNPEGMWAYGATEFAANAKAVAASSTPAAAKELMAEVGKLERPVVMALPAGDSLAIEMAAAIQQYATDIGMEFKTQAMPPEQYGALFSDPASRTGIDLFFTISYTSSRDPLEGYLNTMGTGQLLNFNGYENPKVEELLAAAKATADPTERAKLVVEIENILVDELPWIPVVSPRVRLYQSSAIKGAPSTFVYTSYPWAADITAA